MIDFISIAQIVLSILLIVLILLQRSDASTGAAFGGGDDGGIKITRRGPEKALFYFTILVAVLFVGASVLALIR